jgi:ABC-type xylose transport system substrate-binding protein
MVAEMVNMDKETVRKILREQLNMMKVCAKMVPKNLSQKQKGNRENIRSDIMERITEQPDVLENIITCNETWIFQYDPETKGNRCIGRHPLHRE